MLVGGLHARTTWLPFTTSHVSGATFCNLENPGVTVYNQSEIYCDHFKLFLPEIKDMYG